MGSPPTTGYRPFDAPRRTGYPRATFVQRAGAAIGDFVVAFVCVPVPVSVATWLTGRPLVPCHWQGDEQICIPPEPADLWFSRILFWSLATVFTLVFSYLVSSRHTVGQRATATRVVDHRTEERIGFGRALLRTVMMVPSALAFGAGFWWALIDRHGRTWHDLAARTRVVSP